MDKQEKMQSLKAPKTISKKKEKTGVGVGKGSLGSGMGRGGVSKVYIHRAVGRRANEWPLKVSLRPNLFSLWETEYPLSCLLASIIGSCQEGREAGLWAVTHTRNP